MTDHDKGPTIGEFLGEFDQSAPTPTPGGLPGPPTATPPSEADAVLANPHVIERVSFGGRESYLERERFLKGQRW